MNYRASALALFLVLALGAFAQSSGPSANGDFQFEANDVSKSIVFDARIHQNGQVHGQMTISGADDLPDQDVDGGGDTNPSGSYANMTLTASLDCLVINGDRAVMSGAITSSSVGAYVGLRAILVVEDGGEGVKKPIDRFTWGLYRGNTANWVASDAELMFDPGVGLTWFATDAEREDDAGIPSHPDTQVNCQSFPVSSYDLREVPHGGGNIQVKP